MRPDMSSRITVRNLTIDRDHYQAWVGEQLVELTYVEFELLFLLARNAGKVVTRERIVEALWGDSPDGHTRKLSVHMSRLRKKIADSHPGRIETVTKRGYVLKGVEATPPPAMGRAQRLMPSNYPAGGG